MNSELDQLSSEIAQTNSPEAYVKRAKYLIRHEEKKAALHDLNKAIKLDKKRAESYLARSNFYFEEKNEKKCLKDIDKAISLENNALYHYMKGYYLGQFGRHEKAVTSLEKAIAINPLITIQYLRLGQTYYKLGNYQQALATFDKGIALRDQIALEFGDNSLKETSDWFAPLYYERGILLKEMNQLKEAISDFENAVALKQDYFAVKSELGECFLFLKNYEHAEKLFLELLEHGEEEMLYHYYFNLANTYFYRGRIEEAKVNFQKVVELNPLDIMGLFNSGLNSN